MKKIISLLVCVGVIGLSACSKEDTAITRSETEGTTVAETEQAVDTQSLEDSTEELGDTLEAFGDIDVDQDMLSVTITFQ
jgi:hypothetical protein